MVNVEFSLEPDSAKLDSHKAAIVEAVRLRGEGNTSALEFVGCLTYVLSAFKLIRQVGVTHNNGEDFRDIPKK